MAQPKAPAPWGPQDVLSLGSFPSTSILRIPRKLKPEIGLCTCNSHERHRSLFDLNREVITPCLRSKMNGLPPIKVCWNADCIWECKLPRAITGLPNRVRFEELATVYDAQKVLFSGTYWYRRLITADGLDHGAKHGRNGIAILRLLGGLTSFSGKERIDELVKLKLNVGSVMKLRNLLATVDGLLMQLVLCFPYDEEINSWPFLDRIVNSLISCLLPDYFREPTCDRETAFEKVKKIRKEIKMMGMNPIENLSKVHVPQELSFFRSILKKVRGENTPYGAYVICTLSQTRASGVPPPSVYTKTLKQIREILVQDPGHVFEDVRGMIPPALDELYQEILLSKPSLRDKEKFFSRCCNKAKISLSDSGEFFTPTKEGGKLEAARRVLSAIDKIEVIDLHTGEKTGKFISKDDSRPGELLFMWALHTFHDREKVYDTNAMSVRISLVAELGKYRAITVSHLAHAVLLHVLSHVLLEFLSEFPSSSSGIGAANHAWNFFKRLSHKNPSANFLFNNVECLLFSTDWTQATNYCDHRVAAMLLNRLCVKLGIPQWYRQTCVFALCAPRQVEFIDQENKTLEFFLTKSGVLMGDPVTKVVLHLYHLVVRSAAKQIVRRGRQLC